MATQFRGYTILETLGIGGMASVFLGLQENLKRHVAIKLLDKRLALSEDFVRRFEREARAASELNHRNIITIHEFGNEGGDYFIVMEYVKGSDLQGVLDRVRRFPPEIALVILEEVATGLAAAHEKDIVHRDIKPANVLLSHNGDVKVTDFGLARDYSLDASRLFDSLTVGGTVLGTPSYMSPEQASGLPLDHKTDTFALGVMAYEMFTGQKPFPGETYSAIREAILEGEPRPLTLQRPLATPQIEDMVRRMLAKAPERRPDMRQLLHMIESCMETVDPSGMLLRHRRRFLEKFAADPESFSTRLEEVVVQKSLGRGLYAKALGLERLDVALEHLEYVQQKDPQNSKAMRAIAEIADYGSGTRERRSRGPAKAPQRTRVDTRRKRAFGLVEVSLGVALLAGTSFGVVRSGIWEHVVGRTEPAAPERSPVSAPVISAAATPLPGPAPLPPGPSAADAASSGTAPVPPEAADPAPSIATVAKPETTEPEPAVAAARNAEPAPVEKADLTEAEPPRPAPPKDSWVRVGTEPAGNIFLNGKLLESGSTGLVQRVPPGESVTLEVRHPDLFGSKTWTRKVAPGDTLDLGMYAVKTGTLRVSTRPPTPVEVLLDGRETRKETPLALTVASRQQLVSIQAPGWTVEKVVVSERSGEGAAREILPDDPARFAGVPVDVGEGQDLKVVFHLTKAGG
jgi:serine/threonine protein kinase